MSHTLLVSDLHLAPERQALADLFVGFLTRTARLAESLYVLGDLFDYWVGDEDLSEPFNAAVIRAMADAGRAGCRVTLLHGNRDFLVSDACAAAMGARLLPDPTVADLYGIRTLLSHGDAYCTADEDYLAFRAQVREPTWQRDFLALPHAKRTQMARAARAQSERSKTGKTEEIMDVSPEAIARAMDVHDCDRMVHGHTHRPGRHRLVIAGRPRERWVLGDWYVAGSYLRCDATDWSVHTLPAPGTTG